MNLSCVMIFLLSQPKNYIAKNTMQKHILQVMLSHRFAFTKLF